MSPLPRELVRWIQTLDLPVAIRLPKRDLSNGYLFAEMCARYWSSVELHGFENKLSKQNKEANWKLLRKYFAKNNVDVDDLLIAGVINCDDGCAEQMLFQLYTALTKREIQVFPPLAEAEADHVPVFIKQQQQATTTRSQQNSQLEAQKQAEERARQEANKRAEAQQRQQQQSLPKPKTLAKAQTIQAADKDDHDGSVHHAVQFSSVSVKPLPPQLLARFGSVRQAAADGAEGGANPQGRGGVDGVTGEGVLGAISAQLATTLLDAGLALWPTSAATPTIAEYYFKNLHTIETSLRGVLWSQLISKCEAIADVIAKRPAEFAAFVQLVSAQLVYRAAAPAGQKPPTPPPASGASQQADPAAVAQKYFVTVAASVASLNPAAALSGMREALVPLIARQCPLHAQSAAHYSEQLQACVYVVRGQTPVFLSSFFSAVYDGLCGGSRTRADFLLVLSYVLQGFVFRRKDALSTGSSLAVLDEQCAGIAYYNAVAGLYSSAPADQVAGLLVLVRLVELGAASVVLSNGHLLDLVRSFVSSGSRWTSCTTRIILFCRLVSAVGAMVKQGANISEDNSAALVAAVKHMQEVVESYSNGDTRVVAKYSSAAVKYMVSTVADAMHLFTATTTGDDSSVLLSVAQQVMRGFAPLAAGGTSTIVIVPENRFLGSVSVTDALHGGCPLRLALGILHLTAPMASAGASSGTDARKGAVAKTAAHILKTGDTSELAAERLHWIHTLFDAHCSDTLSTLTHGAVADEDLVTMWWSVVKALEPNISLSLYTAELLSGQLASAQTNSKVAAQLPSEAVIQTVLGVAAYAQGILVRAFIDFSGSVNAPHSPEGYAELRQDDHVTANASKWFNEVVVPS